MPTPEHGSFYCPVCEKTIVFLWIWQDPSSERIRMFCEDCSHLDDYSVLPKDQRIIVSHEGFQRFAGRRQLAHVLERERAKRAGTASSHVED